MGRNQFFIQQIKNSMEVSTGCTEPIAIALNTATARKEAQGIFRKLVIKIDPYLYKNAMGVGIPGSNERGIALCAALGITAGDAESGMNVLANVTPKSLQEAKKIKNLIEIKVIPQATSLFIHSELYTSCDTVRVITHKIHTGIIDVSHAPYEPYGYQDKSLEKSEIQQYTLDDFIDFAVSIPLSEIRFLHEGLSMNQNISKAGHQFGLGKKICGLIQKGYLDRSPSTAAKLATASGSYARMHGVSMPVMTATGSGNQGITLFLTIDGVAQFFHIDTEKELRAIALASLVNIYGKSFIGPLSSICACGIASGLGASAGICLMLDGTSKQIFGAMKNILGSVSGMICDGAKEGCAYKVELSAGLAVDSAFFAMENQCISSADGILSDNLYDLFKNINHLVTVGMASVNDVIIDIMDTK